MEKPVLSKPKKKSKKKSTKTPKLSHLPSRLDAQQAYSYQSNFFDKSQEVDKSFLSRRQLSCHELGPKNKILYPGKVSGIVIKDPLELSQEYPFPRNVTSYFPEW